MQRKSADRLGPAPAGLGNIAKETSWGPLSFSRAGWPGDCEHGGQVAQLEAMAMGRGIHAVKGVSKGMRNTKCGRVFDSKG